MSQLLDSLRRATGPLPHASVPRSARRQRNPRDDGLFAAARATAGSRIAQLILAGAMLVTLTWYAFAASSRASNRERLEVSESTAARRAASVDASGPEG